MFQKQCARNFIVALFIIAKLSITRRDKALVVYSYDGMLYRNENVGTTDTCNNNDDLTNRVLSERSRNKRKYSDFIYVKSKNSRN